MSLSLFETLEKLYVEPVMTPVANAIIDLIDAESKEPNISGWERHVSFFFNKVTFSKEFALDGDVYTKKCIDSVLGILKSHFHRNKALKFQRGSEVLGYSGDRVGYRVKFIVSDARCEQHHC